MLKETSCSHLKEHRMLVAVLTATLFMLSAATGGSAADSCTASLSPLVGEEVSVQLQEVVNL